MKANEFVKKHGIPLAEMIINDSPSWAKSYFLGVEEYEGSDFSQSYEDCISLNCLKRLVESHELVEKHHGLNSARNTLKLLESSLDIGLYHGVEGVEATTEVPRLKQAIADVESCTEAGKRLEVSQ